MNETTAYTFEALEAWANDHGIAVSGRGRIPASVMEQYHAAGTGR